MFLLQHVTPSFAAYFAITALQTYIIGREERHVIRAHQCESKTFPRDYLKKPRSLKNLNAQILKPQVHCCIIFYKLSDSSDKIHEEGESEDVFYNH